MSALALGILVAVTAAAPNATLDAAETAYDQGRFQDVLPLVARALQAPLEPGQAAKAHALAAHVHAAFHQNQAAVQDFRAALAVEPSYRPASNESPKMKDLFAQALGQAMLLAPPQPAVGPLPALRVETPAPAAPRKASRPPWLAIGLSTGAVVVAGVVTAVVLVEDRPAGNLGRASLP